MAQYVVFYFPETMLYFSPVCNLSFYRIILSFYVHFKNKFSRVKRNDVPCLADKEGTTLILYKKKKMAAYHY